MTIKIIDIDDNVDGYGSGATVHFEFEGQTLRYESWHTRNSSGADIYTEGGETWLPEDEQLTDYLDEVIDEYWKAYQKHVNPALETATQFAIAASEAMLGEAKYDGLVKHTCGGVEADDCPACKVKRGEVL